MDRPRTTSFYRGRLPHWEVEDGVYFVTMRVHGTLPKSAEEELRLLTLDVRAAAGDERLVLQRRVLARLEAWLNASTEKLHLSEPPVARMIMEAIANLHERGIWEPIEYVVMPNHIHLLVAVTKGDLRSAMVSFKRWTARNAIALLKLTHRPFWEEEWFDHWPRSALEFERIVAYIRANPVKANLVQDYRKWPYGLWNKNEILKQDAATQ